MGALTPERVALKERADALLACAAAWKCAAPHLHVAAPWRLTLPGPCLSHGRTRTTPAHRAALHTQQSLHNTFQHKRTNWPHVHLSRAGNHASGLSAHKRSVCFVELHKCQYSTCISSTLPMAGHPVPGCAKPDQQPRCHATDPWRTRLHSTIRYSPAAFKLLSHSTDSPAAQAARPATLLSLNKCVGFSKRTACSRPRLPCLGKRLLHRLHSLPASSHMSQALNHLEYVKWSKPWCPRASTETVCTGSARNILRAAAKRGLPTCGNYSPLPCAAQQPELCWHHTLI